MINFLPSKPYLLLGSIIFILLSSLLILKLHLNWVFLLPLLLFTFIITLLIITDIASLLLPDVLTLSLLWLGLAFNSFSLFSTPYNSIWGAIVGYLFLYTLNLGYYLLRGKPGIGGGDFKLLAALGAWVGWKALPLLLLIASFLGLVALLLRMIIKRKMLNQPIAFGPFLAITAWILLFFYV